MTISAEVCEKEVSTVAKAKAEFSVTWEIKPNPARPTGVEAQTQHGQTN